MSIRYSIAEGLVNGLNKVTRGGVKQLVFEFMKDPGEVLDVPERYCSELDVERKSFDGRPVIHLRPADTEPIATVLFVPGGAGLMGPISFHFETATRLAKAVPCEVVMALYPLAPAATADVSLAWLKGVYEQLSTNCDGSPLAVMGDSAGANLLAALLQHVERKPACAVLVSPTPGLDRGADRDDLLACEDDEVFLSVALHDYVAKTWFRGLDPASPDTDPMRVNYQGFPPTWLAYGTHELFAGHDERLVQRIQDAGVDVRLTVGEGLCHCWPLARQIPEGKRAQADIAAFVREHVKGDGQC